MGLPDPGRFMDRFLSWGIATHANKWQGRKLTRWRSDGYDVQYRATLLIRMNDRVSRERYVLPQCSSRGFCGLALSPQAQLSVCGNSHGSLRS